jgi:hypothetical protein
MRTTAGNPGWCRARGQAPANPREPSADSTVLPGFQLRPPLTRGAPAHLTTRTSGAGGCGSPRRRPPTGHRGPQPERRAATRDRGAGQGRCHPPRPTVPEPAASSTGPARATGRTAARGRTRSRPRPAIAPAARVAAGPARVADRQTGPAPGARQFSGSLIRRWPVTAGAASASARGAGGQMSGRAPGQWRPQLKNREGRCCPRMARGGWPGLTRACGTAGVPGCGPLSGSPGGRAEYLKHLADERQFTAGIRMNLPGARAAGRPPRRGRGVDW